MFFFLLNMLINMDYIKALRVEKEFECFALVADMIDGVEIKLTRGSSEINKAEEALIKIGQGISEAKENDILSIDAICSRMDV